MPFRISAKPEDKPKELLYKKPWWWITLPKASYWHDHKNRKFVWNWLRRWRLSSEVSKKKDTLYYTDKGVWVFCAHTFRYDPSDRGTWTWFLYDESLDEIEKHLKTVKAWKATDEARERALTSLQDLLELRDGEINEKREIQI